LSFIKSKWSVIIAVIAGLAIIGTAIFFLIPKESVNQETEEEDLLPQVHVRVVNGCGVKGVANLFTDALYKTNVFVSSTGNANSFNYNKSVIIVKQRDTKDLERLMEMTSIKDFTYVYTDKETVPFLIIIGKDYEKVIKRITSKE